MRLTPNDNSDARELFEKAIALDPNYARVYAWLAWTHFADWQFGWLPGKPKEPYRKALDLAYKALSLDPRDGWARARLGQLLLYGNEHNEGISMFEEGLKANPNDADLLVWWAEAIGFMGRLEEAIQRIKEAMRLNPYYPNWYLWVLGQAQYQSRDYEGAVKTIAQMSPIGEARRFLAGSLAYLGRMEEARAEAQKFLKDNPTFSVSYWGGTQPYRHDTDRQHAMEGFIKAGLPR